MEQVPNNSFIPRQGVGPIAHEVKKRKTRFNIFGFLAVVIFLGSLLLAGGSMVYKTMSEKNLEKAKQDLATEGEKINPADIDSIRKTELHIKTAEKILDVHVSPSLLFDALERSTQESVQFTAFTFVRQPSGTIAVEMTGIAPRFNTVVLQAKRFASEDIFSKIIFSNLNKAEDEIITFKVSVEINQDAIAYRVQSLDIPTVDATPVGESTGAPAVHTIEASSSASGSGDAVRNNESTL